MKLLPDDVADLASHPVFYGWAEPPRLLFELQTLAMATPLIVPLHTTDGHPVLVVSGLGGTTFATLPLRTCLRLVGHRVHTLHEPALIRNPKRIVKNLVEKIDELYGRYHDRVSIIGWCVGGAFARQAAFLTPNHIRQVINLGAPLDGWWYPSDRRYATGPLPVPSTVVYSRTDGLLPWRRVLQQPGPRAENVEVFSSHVGLANNPMTLHLVADRLAQPKGVWAPYAGFVLSDLVPDQFLRSGEERPRGPRAA